MYGTYGITHRNPNPILIYHFHELLLSLLLPVPPQNSLAYSFWQGLHPSQLLAPPNRKSGAPGFCTSHSVSARTASHTLCKPEKLFSPDVLVVPSWHHTLLFRQYPGYCTDGISARNHTLHRTIELRSSGPPRSSRSGAKPSCNFPRRSSKSEVTIDCYSEKQSRPSQWSCSAPTGARAWGALQWQYKRQDKNRLHSRNRSIFFGPEARTISTNRSPLAQVLSTHRSIRLQFARRMGAQTDTLQ